MMAQTSDPFRILSLDGGGIRGVYTASVLAELERKTGSNRIWEHFDLIVGTSTGGILAIALASGISANKILCFYKKWGKSIFPVTGAGKRAWRLFRAILFTKYSTKPLENALRSVLDNKTLGDTWCRLAVTAYSTKRNDLQLFRNFTPDDPHGHLELPSVSVALATSAAPTYFRATEPDPRYEDLNQPYIDGGVCANCPVLVGITEAVSTLSIDIKQIQLLSVGTLYDRFRVGRLRRRGGFGQWNTGAVDLLMHGQQACAVTLAESFLGERMVRVTQESAESVGMDDVRKIDSLENWGKRDLDIQRGSRNEKPIDGIHRIGFFREKAHHPFRE